MKRIRSKLFGVLFLLLLAALIGVPVWLTVKNVHQQQLDRALIAAIKKQDTNKVIALLNEGANANARDIPPETRPFWQQVWDRIRGKRPVVDADAPIALVVYLKVLEHPAYPDNSFDQAAAPSHVDNLPLLEVLLKHGANANVRTADGSPALYWMLGGPYYPNARLFCSYVTDVNACDENGYPS